VGSNDTLKTAKTVIQAIDMSMDGMQSRKIRKPKKKERQKGKKIIQEELRNHENRKT